MGEGGTGRNLLAVSIFYKDESFVPHRFHSRRNVADCDSEEGSLLGLRRGGLPGQTHTIECSPSVDLDNEQYCFKINANRELWMRDVDEISSTFVCK